MNATRTSPRVAALTGAVAIALVLVVAGCAAEGVAPTRATPMPPRTAAPLTPEQATQVLTLGVLQAADLGEGWTEKPYGSDRAVEEVDTIGDLVVEPGCKKLAETIASFSGLQKSRSGTFEQGLLVTANSATTFENPALADKVVGLMNRTDVRECMDPAFSSAFTRQFDKIANDGSTLNSVRTRKVSIDPIGDNRAAFEVSLDLMKDGTIRTLVITRIAVEVGPAILDFSFRSDDHPFPAPETVMKPVVDRVSVCLAGTGSCDLPPGGVAPQIT